MNPAQQPKGNPYEEFLRRYYDNPVEFVRGVLGLEPDWWQQELLRAIAAGKRRISVRSGHGVGKSTAVAWAALWFLITRYPVKIVMTAPTSSQLYDALFAETLRWCNQLPDYVKVLLNPKTDRIELVAAPESAFLSARTSRAETPEALQGVHSEHVMLIADEASGVPERVFEAAAGSMSGHNAVTLLLGNPVRSSGLFYDTHHKLRNSWHTIHVSCLDSKRVSKDFVEEIAQRYGIESNAYRVRVLGEFPRAEDDVVIPLELAEAARARDIVVSPNAREVWGVDIARFGDDSSALLKRRGDVVLPLMSWRGVDLMQSAGRIHAEYLAADPKPAEILVDAIGLGAGVADRLRELGLPVRGINVSETPAVKEKFKNLRAELWWSVRSWLERLQCALPQDEDLIAQMVDVRYMFDSAGRVQIESKEQLKKRGRPSPDRADALALTFASMASSLRGLSVARNKPLSREVPNLC